MSTNGYLVGKGARCFLNSDGIPEIERDCYLGDTLIEFSIDFMSHYPGHSVVYPTIALLVASMSDATISVLGSGKRSDK